MLLEKFEKDLGTCEKRREGQKVNGGERERLKKFYSCSGRKSMKISKHRKYRESRRVKRSRMAFRWSGAQR